MDVDRIVDTALRLIDEVGVKTLSLRMLADALESGTATLYRHLRSKEELLVLVADRILGDIRVPAEQMDGLSWREAATVAADSFYASLRRHPHALPLLAAQVHVGPNGLRVRERLIRLLLSHGFPTGLAGRTYTALGHYVIGLAIQQHGPGTPRPDDQVHLRAYYHSLDPAAYPATSAAADDLTSVPLYEEFRFGLDLLLDGVEQARSALPEESGGPAGSEPGTSLAGLPPGSVRDD
ncbi:TetR/AcrR family transcriptional regulator [Streptomyces sp. NPDC005374]|uniref:TetR/AcrR family transcriptional regulator n=1 Tax=Streptomyces sp. NPDC005374 TaxID=3364713 RepID=UPI0036CC3539